ncbi:MAG: 50S ribosomal protein L6 [Longimicrobiales bacterium]
MSRIGRMPIEVPSGVSVSVDGQEVVAKGPKGELTFKVHNDISVGWDEEAENTLVVTRPSDQKDHRALHGLTRSLVANMVEGVNRGFSKTLEIVGVGYRAEKKGNGLVLNLGFSHQINFPAPDGVNLETPNQTTIVIQGADKQSVGQTAAVIRAFRPPEPYKGKGIRYQGEQVRRKAGKTAGA